MIGLGSDKSYFDSDFIWKQYVADHMGLEHASRDKKLPMVNFLIFGQMNI